jgi:peptide/nickel transport system substrate-binding protein
MSLKKIALLLLMIAMIAVVAACAAQPETAPAVEQEAEVAVEEEAEEPAAAEEAEAAAEEEAEEPVAAEEETTAAAEGAVPYPEAPDLGLGELVVEKLPIDQIVTYRSLPEYHEPDWVTELVEQVKLPPVEERLPKEPQVVLEAAMADGIGEYGDAWYGFSACPTAGWNNGAGVTAGWFGIESYSFRHQALVRTGPLYRADQDIEPLPNLAMSWEWSDDGHELTMHLIEGAKWSDGEPFTSADVIFTWEDYILDPNVNSWVQASNFTWDGETATLEAIDDYTIKWTFPVPFPKDKYYLMDDEQFIIMPMHQMKPLHPKYNTDMDYKSFENALPPDALPAVTMGAWVPVEYKTDELLIMRRNPYFWKVDEAGNQLPYIDEMVYQKGPSGVGRDLCTMAGGCDHTNLENPSTFVETLKRAEEPDAHFEVSWGPELLGYAVELNQSVDLGVEDERDAALRELFRNITFRRALSHATDRDGIAQSIMRGPFLRPWAGGLYPGSPDFERESVTYYAYNPDRASELLAELGFEDTDGNGFLNWTSGPLAGEDLAVAMSANEDQAEAVTTAEALVSNWAQAGIKINFRPVTSAARNDIIVSGDWEMHVSRQGQVFALPFTRCNELAPVAKTAPAWHREGENPRVLQDFEEELIAIVEEYCTSTDPALRKSLINDYNRIFTENVYDVGVFVGRYGLGLAKRFRNVPGGTPVFLYTWVEDAIMAEQVWVPKDEQREQIRPNTIPEYNK